MKNHFAKSILLLTVLTLAVPADAYDFSESNNDGIVIYYNVISEDNRTCEVTAMEDGRTNSETDSFTDYVGNVKIPSSANGYQVSRIGKKAFLCCRSLSSVEIPNSVTTIGSSAFYGCTGLSSVSIPNSVSTIDDNAFMGCSGLTSVTIPNSVTYLGYFAFWGCSGMTSLEISNSITRINNCTFFRCSSLSSVTIPNSVKDIGSQAFQECYGLVSVEIPNSVTTISNNAFCDCRALASLSIPSSVTKIEDGAFLSCKSLSSVTIPSTVTKIGDNPFMGCSYLTSIIVEEGNPNYNSANNCNAIIETNTNKFISGCKNSVIPNYITVIGRYAFSYCTDLPTLAIPNSVTTIESRAFQGCGSLTIVEIPNSVEYIGESAFLNCAGLTSVTIPNSVTTIESGAFRECGRLSSITSYITDVFETGSWAFYGSSNATLYVPKGMVSTYQSTPDWNRFANVKEIIESIPMTLACSDHGKVTINDNPDFSNDIGDINVYDGQESTFTFTPNEGCHLDRVLLNGLDVTRSVEDDQLKATITPNSKMMVVFSPIGGDVNGDGRMDVNDVVLLVNLILGNF